VLATGHLWADSLQGLDSGAAAVPDRAARLLIALTLPPTATDRRLRPERHESPAEAGPSVPVMDHH
jgi:hypothetical protein